MVWFITCNQHSVWQHEATDSYPIGHVTCVCAGKGRLGGVSGIFTLYRDVYLQRVVRFLAVLQWPLLVKSQPSHISGGDRAWRSNRGEWIGGQEGEPPGLFNLFIRNCCFVFKKWWSWPINGQNFRSYVQYISTWLTFIHHCHSRPLMVLQGN